MAVDGPATNRFGWARLRRLHLRYGGPPLPIMATSFLVVVALAAAFGPLIYRVDPYAGSLMTSLQPPIWDAGGSWAHALGTDQLGRDIAARILMGGRITLLIAVSGVIASAAVGTIVGLVAGYFGSWADALLMRITDATLAIPMLVLGLALATSLGPGLVNVVIVVTAITWAFFARLVRGEVLHLRRRDYVLAAQISGIPRWRILFGHVLPNVLTPILVMSSLQVGNTVIIAASLSFLGLGVPEPEPEWGLMIANSRDYLSLTPYLVVIPAVALGALVLASNVFGDWLRDRFDPGMARHN